MKTYILTNDDIVEIRINQLHVDQFIKILTELDTKQGDGIIDETVDTI